MYRNELQEKKECIEMNYNFTRKEEMYRNELQKKKKCIEMNCKIRRNVQK